jgi:hypothetical protein
MSNLENMGGEKSQEQIIRSKLNDIGYRVDVNKNEYSFVGNSAQKDYETLVSLETELAAAPEEVRETFSETLTYLKNRLDDLYDIDK